MRHRVRYASTFAPSTSRSRTVRPSQGSVHIDCNASTSRLFASARVARPR